MRPRITSLKRLRSNVRIDLRLSLENRVDLIVYSCDYHCNLKSSLANQLETKHIVSSLVTSVFIQKIHANKRSLNRLV